MHVLQGRQGSGGQKGGMIEAGWSSADIEYPLICVDVVHVCGVVVMVGWMLYRLMCVLCGDVWVDVVPLT